MGGGRPGRIFVGRIIFFFFFWNQKKKLYLVNYLTERAVRGKWVKRTVNDN